MRVYEYHCKKCGKEYLLRTYIAYNGETLQCPNCGGEDYEVSEYNPFSEDYSEGSCVSFGGG